MSEKYKYRIKIELLSGDIINSEWLDLHPNYLQQPYCLKEKFVFYKDNNGIGIGIPWHQIKKAELTTEELTNGT